LISAVRLAAGVLLLWCAARSATAAELPEWLEAARHVELGEFGKGSPAVIIESRVEFSVDASGRFTEKTRAALLILNRRAAEQYLHVSGYEDSDQAVTSIQAWSIAPGGRVEKTEKKDIITRASYAEFILYSDSLVKSVTIPSVQDGSVVGYEMTRQGKLVVSSERFSLERNIPVWLSEVRVTIPFGSLRYFINFPDRVETGMPSSASQASQSVSFRAQRRPAVVEESNMPPYWSVRAAVFVNYDPAGPSAVKSWDDAGRASYPLFAGALRISPEIAAEADRLTMTLPDPVAKMRALSDFVSRKIRYVAIEIGEGGYRPHPAGEVFSNRYGDCKDKAVLLISMLDRIGVQAYPALIGTRGAIEADPKLPGMDSFNHMIVAVLVPEPLRQTVAEWPAYDAENQLLWIDPTSDTHPLGELPEMDQGVYSLVVSPERGALYRTPEAPAERNGREYHARLRLDANGKGQAQVRVAYLGNANASRHGYYRGRSQSEIRKGIEARLSRYVSQAALTEVTVEGMEENHLAIVENLTFQGSFASATAGAGWFFQPLFLSGMESWELSAKPRVHALDLGVPYGVRGQYEIELPLGFELDRLPDPVSVDTEFGSIRLEYTLAEDGQLMVLHETIYRLARIGPEQYPAFRDFLNQSSRLERQLLRLRPIQ
jgi:transglutaminase-like putative cysteine protease